MHAMNTINVRMIFFQQKEIRRKKIQLSLEIKYSYCVFFFVVVA